MTPESITLILNIIFIAMLGFGFLFGLKGLKKSTSSLITFIVSLIVIIFLVGPVSNMILQININGQSLENTMSSAINSMLGSSLSSNEVVQSLIKGIPLMIISIVVSILLIFIIGSIFKLIGSIVYRLIFGKDEKVVEDVEIVNNVPQITKRTIKKKKHRLLGGCVGLVHGLLFSIVVFMPLVGLVNIANNILDVNNTVIEETGAPETLSLSSMQKNRVIYLTSEAGDSSFELKPAKDLLRENLPAEFFDYAKALDNSIFAKVGKIGNLSEKTLDLVARCNINGYTIKLGEEIKTLVGVYDEFVDFATEASEKLGTTDLNVIFNDIAENPTNYDFEKLYNLVEHLFNSNLVKSIGNDGLKLIADTLVEQNTNEDLQPILLHVQTAINNYCANKYEIKDDAIALLGVFEISAKNGLIKEVKKQDISVQEISNILLSNSEAVLNNLCGKIEKSNLIQKLVIEAINYGSSCLQNYMNSNITFVGEGVKLEKIDGTQNSITSTELATVLSCALNLYQEIDKNVDFKKIEENFYNIFDYNLEKMIKLAGDGIDGIKNMSIIKNSNLFGSICEGMSNSVEYSKYLSFTELSNSSNLKEQFSKIAESVSVLQESNVIATLKNMNDENVDESISSILNQLSAKDSTNKTLSSKILTPILSCSIMKNTIIYGLDNVHYTIESTIDSMSDEKITISKLNTTTIQTENGNNQLLGIIEKLLEYAKNINLTNLKNNMIDTLVESDLQKLGIALDAVKSSTLFSSNGTDNGAYIDIIDGLGKSSLNSVLDFSVAKSTSFSWESELSTLKNTINTLNEIKITDKSETSGLVSYLLNDGDFNIAYDFLNLENSQYLKPLFEIALIKPVAVSVINTINSKIKDFVGTDLGANITTLENSIVLKEQEPQQIADVIGASTQIDFNETDLDNIDNNKLNYLLLKLENNAEIDGVFKESYNALLLKVANMINENVQTFTNITENTIQFFTSATNVLDYSLNIRYVLNSALNSVKSIKSATIETLNTTVLFDFVDALKLNSTMANGIFNNTYNTIMIYIVNKVNSQISEYVGDTFATNIVIYKGSDEAVADMGGKYNYIKEIIESAVDAYKSIGAGEELKDIDSKKLSRLLDALDSIAVTRPAYNALNNKLANEIILEINNLTGKSAALISEIKNLSDQATDIKNILTVALEVAPQLDSESFVIASINETTKQNLLNLLTALQTNGEKESGILAGAYNSVIEYIEEQNGLSSGYIKTNYSENGKIDWNSFISA